MGQTMKTNSTVMKIAQTALFAALCYVIFTYLQIKIPMPGGDATSNALRYSRSKRNAAW